MISSALYCSSAAGLEMAKAGKDNAGMKAPKGCLRVIVTSVGLLAWHPARMLSARDGSSLVAKPPMIFCQ